MTKQPEFICKGAIVRIKLRNFMTYSKVHFFPGPNLNMILGPNGTGKSAIVCCIIVGLAGEVNLTGRGSSPADFVKKDTEYGTTEIELFNDMGPNFVVERKIIVTSRSKFKIDHKSEWKINKKTVLKAEVQKLTKKLNIKVDNLCQFLPQDSVTQFVKMNTCELLINTLKAAGDNQLVEDHQKLVENSRSVEEKSNILASLEKSCEENEVNAKRLEGEVHQLRQREQLVKQKNVCSQKIHYVKYLTAKTDCDHAREVRDKLKDDLKDIEANCEPFKRAVELHKSEEARIKQATEASNTGLKSLTNLINSTQSSIENRKIDCQTEFAKFKGKVDQENQRENTIRLKQQELESLECRLSEARDVDCSRQMEQIKRDMGDRKSKKLEVLNKRESYSETIRNHQFQMNEIKREAEQIEQINDKKASFLRQKFPEVHKVLEWLAAKKGDNLFRKRIYLPLMCEINVKDPKFNRIVEHAINRQELTAFVCQTPEDVSTFTRSVRDELKIRFNVILAPEKTVSQFEYEASQRPDLKHLGVTTMLKDLVDAPEPVMRVLYGSSGFHRIPVVEKCSESQLKEMMNTCPRFYANGQFYSVSKSRYDNQSMVVSDPVREAQLIKYSLDKKRLDECRDRYTRLQKTTDENKKARDDLLQEDIRLTAEWQQLKDKYDDLQLKHEERNRLEMRIQRNRNDIEKLKTEKIDVELERSNLQKSIEKINMLIIQGLEKLVELYASFAESKKSHMLNLLLCKLAARNHRFAQKKLISSQRDTTRLREEINKKTSELNTFKAALAEYERIAEEKIPGFSEGELDSSTQRKFNALEENTVEALTDKREDLTIRIQRIYKDASNSILAEFNKQNEELKEKRIRIEQLKSSIRELDITREEVKRNWLPRLKEVIEVIDKHYQEFMQKLCYDGQVKLDFNQAQPENFSAYGIMILVKYRDNEQLIPLSSTRQSGGERSVATMIYMLALQTKTTVPFRCVDEINQGMDKENERKVFELLVQTADSSSSQYFLVSPKLLNNLPYSEKMKIHVVFNGKNLKLAWNDVLKPNNSRD